MCRATFNSNPEAIIVTISDDPPYDMNGRVRPVIGMMPTIPPMLMNV